MIIIFILGFISVEYSRLYSMKLIKKFFLSFEFNLPFKNERESYSIIFLKFKPKFSILFLKN